MIKKLHVPLFGLKQRLMGHTRTYTENRTSTDEDLDLESQGAHSDYAPVTMTLVDFPDLAEPLLSKKKIKHSMHETESTDLGFGNLKGNDDTFSECGEAEERAIPGSFVGFIVCLTIVSVLTLAVLRAKTMSYDDWVWTDQIEPYFEGEIDLGGLEDQGALNDFLEKIDSSKEETIESMVAFKDDEEREMPSRQIGVDTTSKQSSSVDEELSYGQGNLLKPILTTILVVLLLYTFSVGVHFMIQECTGEEDICNGDESEANAERRHNGPAYSFIEISVNSPKGRGGAKKDIEETIQTEIGLGGKPLKKKKWVLNQSIPDSDLKHLEEQAEENVATNRTSLRRIDTADRSDAGHSEDFAYTLNDTQQLLEDDLHTDDMPELNLLKPVFKYQPRPKVATTPRSCFDDNDLL